MVKNVSRTNNAPGYINVGLTSTQYSQAQLTANEIGESIHSFVAVAINQRLRRLEDDKRQALYIDACQRARENNMPTVLRGEFYRMMGWSD